MLGIDPHITVSDENKKNPTTTNAFNKNKNNKVNDLCINNLLKKNEVNQQNNEIKKNEVIIDRTQKNKSYDVQNNKKVKFDMDSKTSKNKKQSDHHIQLTENENSFELIYPRKKNGKQKQFMASNKNDGRRKQGSTSKVESSNISSKGEYDLVYITNVPTWMNEGTLSGYIKNELNIRDFSCHLIVPFNMRRSELRYLNFKIRALKTDVDLLLRKENWPDNVRPRLWKIGHKKRMIDQDSRESGPYKPNFRRN